SPLKVAAHLGLAEIVEKLLKSSPESYSPEHRRDALVMAVEEGHAATVAVIFQTGGLELEMGVLALKKACEFGRESVVEWVLDFWKDPEYRTGLQLDTCLCSAAKFGHAKIARLLIDAGSDVNTTSDDKRTPLMLAAEGGYEETVLELLEAKADVEVKANILYVIRSWNESCQITALQLAASSGHIAALQALLHVGNCSVDETTFGTTALHMAAKAGHGAIVQELLNKGAN
ncbi:ankyrin, partial [Wilcoxina mikolae CBS 423.85]